MIIDSLQRVSSKKQTAEERTGLSRQSTNIDNWLLQHPESTHRKSIVLRGESAYSGTHLKGEFGVYLDDLEQGVLSPPDTLLIDDFSRLSRLPLSLAQDLVRRLHRLDVTIVTVSDNQIYSPKSQDELESMIGLLFRLKNAHADSERKSRHLRAARLSETERIKSGGLLRKKLPFWLSIEDDTYVVDEAKASIVRLVHDLYQSNHSYTDILKHMHIHGIATPSKRAKDWTVTTIVNILQSSAAVGIITFNHAEKPTETLEDHFPVIIPRHVFDLSQALLQNRKGTRSGGGSYSFTNVFRGVIRCGECGYSVSVSKNRQGRVYLSCEGRKRRGTTIADCKNGRYRHDLLLDKVLYHLSSIELTTTRKQTNVEDLRLLLSAKQSDYERLRKRLLLIDDDLLEDFTQDLRKMKDEIAALNSQLTQSVVLSQETDVFTSNLSRIDVDTVDGRRDLNKHLSRYLSEITYSTVTGMVKMIRREDGKKYTFPLLEQVSYRDMQNQHDLEQSIEDGSVLDDFN